MTLFDSRHLLYQLLWNMFSKEVELADSMQTLFRGNSLASKIMTFCFKVPLCFHWHAVKSNDHSQRQMIRIKFSCEFPSVYLFRCTGPRICRSYWSRCSGEWSLELSGRCWALRWIPPGIWPTDPLNQCFSTGVLVQIHLVCWCKFTCHLIELAKLGRGIMDRLHNMVSSSTHEQN